MKNKFRIIIPLVLAGASAGTATAQMTQLPGDGEFDGYGEIAMLRGTSITLARETSDFSRVPQRRFRAGLIGVPVVDVPAPVYDAKGGMEAPPKGAVVAAPPAMKRWEIFGGLFYLDENVDQAVFRPEYDVETWGGMAGVRYRLNENWAIGGLVNYSSSDVDANFFGVPLLIGGLDIDMLALGGFVDYTLLDVFANADLWVGFSYTHGWQDYNYFGATLDGDTDTLELGAELAFDSGPVRHGPIVGLRYIDGSVDFLFTDINAESFASTLGYQVSFPIDISSGTMVPMIVAAWEHEFEDDWNVAFGPTSTVDEDLLVAGAGIGWYFDSGWNLVLDYRGRFGSEAESHYVGLKAGITF